MEWRRACALDPNRRDYSARCRAAAQRYLPTKPRGVLLDEGAGATVEWLETEKWANAPEYVRPRSKYYYFYEWMRERISDHSRTYRSPSWTSCSPWTRVSWTCYSGTRRLSGAR